MKKALLSLFLTIACASMAFSQNPATVKFSTTDTVACGSFTWSNDSIYTASTVDTYTSGDTVYVLNLVLEAPKVDTLVAVPVAGACSAHSLWNDKVWGSDGFYLDTIRIPGQCDSVIKVQVTLSGLDTLAEETATACDFYVASWGDTIRATNIGTDVTFTTATCQLLVNSLNITIKNAVVTPTKQITADGCSYDWNGINITAPNVAYYDTLLAANGCDSIISLMVTAFSGNAYNTTDLVVCDYYVNGTDTVRTSTTLTTTTEVSPGCFDHDVINLTVRYTFTDTNATIVRDTIGGCSLSWFGNTYGLNHIGQTFYAYDKTTLGECDSLVAIRLTALDGNKHDTVEVSYCGNNYTWNGNAIQATGEYTHVDSTAATATTPKCYTTHHLLFTLTDRYVDTTHRNTVNRCGSYKFPFNPTGNTTYNTDTAVFTTSGVYTEAPDGRPLISVDNATKCATHYTLTVNVIPISQNGTYEVETTACDSYDFRFFGSNVINHSVDTTIFVQRRTNNSCFDSTGHLKLTINRRSYADYNVDTCDSYTWTGFTNTTYTASTVDSLRLTNQKNSVGCDSIGRLNLVINTTPEVVIEGSWNLETSANGDGTAHLVAVCEEEGVTYAWFLGTETTPASTSETLDANVTSNTDVRLETTSLNGCVAKNWITITLGIEGSDDINVSIYPNPASRYINIESAEGLRDVVIYNAIGQQVINRTIGANMTTLDLGNLASGNYTMRITALNGEQTTRKFIVNK